MYWRLVIDPPQYLGMQMGVLEARRTPDVRVSESVPTYDVDRKITVLEGGIVMMRPLSVMRRNLDSSSPAFVPIDFLRPHPGQQVRDVRRGAVDSSLRVAVTSGRHHEVSAGLYSAGQLAFPAGVNADPLDELIWAYESTFPLQPDQPFIVKFRVSHEEYLRRENMLALQWGEILLHISFQGVLRVYRYEGGNYGQAPKFISESRAFSNRFHVNQDHWLFVIPIGGRGIGVHHSMGSTRSVVVYGNHELEAGYESTLLRFPSRRVGDYDRVAELSPLRIAINTRASVGVGIQLCEFPMDCGWVSRPFHVRAVPLRAPRGVQLRFLPTLSREYGGGTASLYDVSGVALWTPSAGPIARLRGILSTQNPFYTPFLVGWDLDFGPQGSPPNGGSSGNSGSNVGGWSLPPGYVARDPGPIVIFGDGYGGDPRTPNDVLRGFELTEDALRRFEGHAELLVRRHATALRMERGDGTWLLQYCFPGMDPGVEANWHLFASGLYTLRGPMEFAHHPDHGPSWSVTLNLHSMDRRLEEIPHRLNGVFAGKKLWEAFNMVFEAAGFHPLPESDYPLVARTRVFPSIDGDINYRYFPRPGDTCLKVIRDLLMLARVQNAELVLLYDYVLNRWVLEERVYRTSPVWTFSYVPGRDWANRYQSYESLRMEVFPPEANILQVVGVAEKSGSKESYVASSDILVYHGSFTDTNSLDYLGRAKPVTVLASMMTDPKELNRMAYAIAPRIFRGRYEFQITLPYSLMHSEWVPNQPALVVLPSWRDYALPEENRHYPGWIWRRTLTVRGEDHSPYPGIANERLTLDISTTWETPVHMDIA